MRSYEKICVIDDELIEGQFTPPKVALRKPLSEMPPERVRLAAIRKASRKIALGLASYFGTAIDGLSCAAIAEAFRITAGLRSPAKPGVEAIVRRQLGQPLTAEIAVSIGAMLVNYSELLERGFLIPEWDPAYPCWSASDIKDMTVTKFNIGGPRMVVEIYHWTGLLAGSTRHYTISAKWLAWLARQIGAGKKYPVAARDLVGMEAWLVPGLLPSKKLGLLKATADKAMMARNRNLVKSRWIKTCKQIIACNECKLGRDKCRLACRRKTEEI